MIKIVNKKVRKILSDPFWRNVATLFTGTAIGQALPILVFPLLTRLYSKEALGFYFMYAAIGMILQIIASLQYQLAIVIPKSKKEADVVFELSLGLVFFISALLYIIVAVFFDFFSGFIEQKEFAYWLYTIPVSTLFLGVFRVCSHYLIRNQHYKYISIANVIKAVVFSVLQIVFGLAGYLSSGLILSLLLGQALCALYLLYIVVVSHKFSFFLNLQEMWCAAKKYKDMPIYNTTIAAISVVSNQLPLFFLSKYFGFAASGDYGVSNKVVSTPMELIGTSIAQVFAQESADTVNREGNLHHLVKTTYLRLFKIAIVPFVLLFGFSYWLFPILFGEGYQSAGIMTMILIPWLFLHFLNSPQSFLFNVLNKQKFMTVYHTLFFACRLAALYAGFYVFNNIYLAIGFFSVVGIIFNIFLISYYLKISKMNSFHLYVDKGNIAI